MTETMTFEEITSWLRENASIEFAAGMARFGIRPARAHGIPMPALHKVARKVGADHALAARLWEEEGSHEARVIAAEVADPHQMTRQLAERWAATLDNWATCDSLCMYLLWRTPFAAELAEVWSSREEEFVKRAAFALIACTAWKDKQATDDAIAAFLPLIVREAHEQRPMARKAVNWALREIGKRSAALNGPALTTAYAIRNSGVRSARWVASNAIRELESAPVRHRLGLT